MKKYNIWHIEGYSNIDDINKDIVMDDSFSKEDVIKTCKALYGENATILNCDIVWDGTIDAFPPISPDFKRYIIEPDGRKYFNKDFGTNEAEQMQYEEFGFQRLVNAYFDIITHKNAKITCDYLHKFTKYEKLPVNCYSKVLSTKLNKTDICFNSLLNIINNLPWSDPDFKEREHQYYDIEYPQRYQEDRLKNIDNRRKEFRRNHGKKPNKQDMERIIHDVDYYMSRFHCPGELVPSIYPEYNCLEVEVSDKIDDPDLDAFVKWLKSIDLHMSKQRLENGIVVDYRNLSLSDWKFYSKQKNRPNKRKNS